MKIILHLGAQRTATTSFQHYMRANTKTLAEQGIGFWGPKRTRGGGFFDGLFEADGISQPQIERARRRVARGLEASRKRGVKVLVVSDENMLGSAKKNLRSGALYPCAAERLARFATAFDGAVDKVLLGVRKQSDYWPSAIAYAVGRGAMLPNHAKLDAIVESTRSWQDVTQDVAAAFGGAEVELHEFNAFAATPNLRLELATGVTGLPPYVPNLRLNEAPDLDELRAVLAARSGETRALPEGAGRYQPFSTAQLAELGEQYDDDLFWLAAGAGGLAAFVEKSLPQEAGQSLPSASRRGHNYDEARRLDRAG